MSATNSSSNTQHHHEPKADAGDFPGRFREIMADPSNAFIARVEDAGREEDGLVTMHNGLRVQANYYGTFSEILKLNKGVHEPQEERMFASVLEHVPAGATMVELGAYWAFYSLWFQTAIPGAKNWMIEPELANLEVGRRNFELNHRTGEFKQGLVGHDGMDLLGYFAEQQIDHIHLLHADIQGAELELLDIIEDWLRDQRIDYLFISTHSQALHTECAARLIAQRYLVIASADFDNETYCYDGVLVARSPETEGPSFVALPGRSAPS